MIRLLTFIICCLATILCGKSVWLSTDKADIIVYTICGVLFAILAAIEFIKWMHKE